MTVATTAGTTDWLERHTSESRRRVAEQLFLGRRARPVDHLVSRAYFAVAARRWAGYSDVDHHLAAFRTGLGHVAPPARALDLGTGAGDAAALVAATYRDAEVIGVDTSGRMLRAARARHTAPNLTFRRCSVAVLPFGDAMFDLATCVNAVPDPVELARVVRRSGQVLAAATTLPLRDEASEWVARWAATGFRRVDGGDVEGGSWEIYVHEGAR